MCQTLYDIKTVRDKLIGHAERIPWDALPDISCEGITRMRERPTEGTPGTGAERFCAPFMRSPTQ